MAGNTSKLVSRAQELLTIGIGKSGFGKAFEKTQITSATETTLAAEFQVTEDMTNVYGTLHGGASATILDVVSSVGLMIMPDTNSGVSVNLNINYMKAAKIGEWLTVESEALKVGRTLAYLGIKLKRKEDGALIAAGTHIKHVAS